MTIPVRRRMSSHGGTILGDCPACCNPPMSTNSPSPRAAGGGRVFPRSCPSYVDFRAPHLAVRWGWSADLVRPSPCHRYAPGPARRCPENATQVARWWRRSGSSTLENGFVPRWPRALLPDARRKTARDRQAGATRVRLHALAPAASAADRELACAGADANGPRCSARREGCYGRIDRPLCQTGATAACSFDATAARARSRTFDDVPRPSRTPATLPDRDDASCKAL